MILKARTFQILIPESLVSNYFQEIFINPVAEVLELKRKVIIELFEKWIPLSTSNDFIWIKCIRNLDQSGENSI
jgi:hypothetical protein